MKIVNLARKPFLNARPLRRLALALWLVGAFLIALNVWLYRSFWTGSAEARDQLALTSREIRQEATAIRQLDDQLGGLRLRERNRQVSFLNRLVKERTFPWSELFEDLEEVLPLDVKLSAVRPDVRLAEDLQRRSERRSRRPTRRRGAPPPEPVAEVEEEPEIDEVVLQLGGTAKTDEALLELVDSLYEDPSFRDPLLERESMEAGSNIRFNMTVVYLTHKIREGVEAVPTTIVDVDGGSEEASEPPGVPEDAVPEDAVPEDSGTLAAQSTPGESTAAPPPSVARTLPTANPPPAAAPSTSTYPPPSPRSGAAATRNTSRDDTAPSSTLAERIRNAREKFQADRGGAQPTAPGTAGEAGDPAAVEGRTVGSAVGFVPSGAGAGTGSSGSGAGDGTADSGTVGSGTSGSDTAGSGTTGSGTTNPGGSGTDRRDAGRGTRDDSTTDSGTDTPRPPSPNASSSPQIRGAQIYPEDLLETESGLGFEPRLREALACEVLA